MEIRILSPARGAFWLLEGFNYFKRSVGTWIGIGMIMLVILFTAAILPLAGFIIQFFLPVFTGGLVLGCRNIDQGGEIGIRHLFAGFNQYTGNLLLVGVFYSISALILFLFLLVILFFTVGGTGFFVSVIDGDSRILVENYSTILLVSLIGLTIYIPLLMAVWFAPALIVLEGTGALVSMKYSFIGCIKNIFPFLIYGLVSLPLILLATIPVMLGWFILAPMFVASLYVATKDIYVQTQTG